VKSELLIQMDGVGSACATTTDENGNFTVHFQAFFKNLSLQIFKIVFFSNSKEKEQRENIFNISSDGELLSKIKK
jgi:hypothetical protein